MGKLKELLLTFNAEEISDLKVFINRYGIKENRLDFTLIDLLRDNQDYTGEELVDKLYADQSKKAAYHTLRKRLFRNISDFVTIRTVEQDHTASGPLMSMILLVKYLVENDCYDLAWKHLKKAQDIAENSDQFSLLHDVYLMQLEYAQLNPKFNIEEIFKKIETNKKLRDEEERFQMAFSAVQTSLREYKKSMHFELETIMQKNFDRFQLHDILESRPKFIYKLIEMVRSAKMTTKGFQEFEPFVDEHYKNMSQFGFRDKDLEYQAGILYILLHTKFRNKKFKECTKFINELESLLDSLPKALKKKFFLKLTLMKAAVCAYTGDPRKALLVLDEIVESKEYAKNDEAIMTALVNKSIYHFFLGETKEANQIHVQFPFTDKQVEKKMGREWALKKALIFIIYQFDIENYELVISLVRNFQRNYDDLIKKDIYTRVKGFAYVIRDLAAKPENIGNDGVWHTIDSQFVTMSFEEEDLQAMTFYGWLRAKFNGLDFYPSLMQHIEFEGDQSKYVPILMKE